MSTFPAGEQTCRRFSTEAIRLATNNFDEKLVIGKGGFGTVYTATIWVGNSKSCMVAIKRLDSSSNQGAPEFWSEIEMLSNFRHRNLVSLIGYCNDNSEMILVYELMAHGSLYDHLHKYGTNLSWVQRLKIGIGAARGLQYLHTGTSTQHGVIHRDVKSSNILLDREFVAKISDFGLSKIGLMNPSGTYVNTLVRGTFGYFDPEYFLTGRLTRKSDVFAFGVVLFELLSGRVALSTSLDEDKCSLAKWAHECIVKGKVHQIIDKRIKRQIYPKCLKVFMQIAHRCLHSESKRRPTMAEIVVALELTLSLQLKFDSHVKPLGTLAYTKWMRCLFFSPELHSAQSDTKCTTNNQDAIEYSPFKDIVDRLHHVSAQISTKPLGEDSVDHASLSKEDSTGGQLEAPPVRRIQILVHDMKMYSFSELKKATGDFRHNMRLGAGEFGEVFKGCLNAKTDSPFLADAPLRIAVKRLYHIKIQHHAKEKCLDLTILSAFTHPNLVKVLGYCFEDEKMFLVYEFVENGSLEGHLFKQDKEPLPWNTRVKIAIGTAKALSFLHTTQNQVDNRPLRLRNILLDAEFNAKLSDFEAAKLVHGNSYSRSTGQTDTLQVKGNVHALGVILLQILTGKHISKIEFANLRQALRAESKERFARALDPRLSSLNDTTLKQALELADLAFRCLDEPSYTLNQALNILGQL